LSPLLRLRAIYTNNEIFVASCHATSRDNDWIFSKWRQNFIVRVNRPLGESTQNKYLISGPAAQRLMVAFSLYKSAGENEKWSH
jgi:hypothetical protein